MIADAYPVIHAVQGGAEKREWDVNQLAAHCNSTGQPW